MGATVCILIKDYKNDGMMSQKYNYGSIENLNKIWGERLSESQPDCKNQIGRERFFLKGFECITKCFPDNTKNVLEVGCGTSRFLAKWSLQNPECKAYGIDKSTKVVHQAVQEQMSISNLCIIAGDAFCLPFPDNMMDVSFSEGLLEHYHPPQQEKIIREMIRVTMKGKPIITAVPNYNCPSLKLAMAYNGIKKDSFDETIDNWRYGYEKPMKHKEAIELYEKVGLSNIKVTSGWSPWYGLKMYRWDHSKKKPVYPWFQPVLSVTQQFIECITSIVDFLCKNKISYFFGYEFVVKGFKK